MWQQGELGEADVEEEQRFQDSPVGRSPHEQEENAHHAETPLHRFGGTGADALVPPAERAPTAPDQKRTRL